MTLFCFFLIDKPFVRLTRKKREDPNKTGEITLILQRYKRKKKKKKKKKKERLNTLVIWQQIGQPGRNRQISRNIQSTILSQKKQKFDRLIIGSEIEFVIKTKSRKQNLGPKEFWSIKRENTYPSQTVPRN